MTTRSTAAHHAQRSSRTSRVLASLAGFWADAQHANRRIFELQTRVDG